MGNDLALPTMLYPITYVEYAWDSGDKSLIVGAGAIISTRVAARPNAEVLHLYTYSFRNPLPCAYTACKPSGSAIET